MKCDDCIHADNVGGFPDGQDMFVCECGHDPRVPFNMDENTNCPLYRKAERMDNADNLNSIAQVIANLQMIRNAAKNRAVKAYDAEDIRSFEYWTGRYDATTEALDHIMVLQDVMVGRSLVKKEVKQ